MRHVLILDTETTGLDHQKDSVIEVAAILYSVEHATPLRSFSSLMYATGNAAENINRIPAAALADAWLAEEAWAEVSEMAGAADAIIAHNADFDRPWCPQVLQDMPWICSKVDLQWPKQTRPEPSLVALALEHDLGVAYAHRALADCDMIARLLTRARELGANLAEMLVRGQRPKILLQAMVSFDERELAKTAGFRWDPTTKRWLRRMVAEDAVGLPFKVTQVGG
jgi:DNA polymerase-3 subunit epsilon